MSDWFTASLDFVPGVLLSAVAVYAALIGLVRLVGLRSFSKMSSFDFAMTVAVGSLVAGTVSNPSPALPPALLALASLFGLQYTIALLRRRTDWAERLVDNEPLLLMRGGEILHDNLRRARVTEQDLIAKLREANVLAFSTVHAVVLETTGNISVLHGPPGGPPFEPRLLSGVRDPAS